MTPSEHIKNIVENFNAGRYAEVCRHYRTPLTIRIGGDTIVARSTDMIWQFYQSLHSFMEAVGNGQLSAELAAVHRSLPDRLCLETRWFAVAAGTRRFIMETVCHSQIIGGGLATDELEFRILAEEAQGLLQEVV